MTVATNCTLSSHLEAIKNGNYRFENAFQGVARMILSGEIEKVVVNGKGNPWICDCEANPSKDLAEQGCWQLREEGSIQSKEGRLRQK